MGFDIPFIRPIFPDSQLIGADFEKIVESNWYTNFGPREREFSQAISNYLGGDVIAVTFSNATLGLMALISASLGRGDGTRFVAIPTFTFAAGAAAIEWAGYRPLLVDIDETDLQPSLDDASGAIDSGEWDVAGILLCNTFGIGNQRIDEWTALAERASIPLLIDSAAGFGSRYDPTRRVGTEGAAEVFSFHATKPFAIGEGGAVVTRDAALADQLRSFQNFGFRDGHGAATLGLNGKLQEINAAIGLRQLDAIDTAVERRQAVAHSYAGRLETANVRFPSNHSASSVCFASALFATETQRDAARDALTSAGVEVRSYYSPAIHAQPHFGGSARVGDLHRAESVGRVILSLPVHTAMDQRDIDLVTNTILGAL